MAKKKRVMKLIDKERGIMKCIICGHQHISQIKSSQNKKLGITKYNRGYNVWQCPNGCKL